MKKRHWKTYAFWIVLTEAVGALSGWLSREGMETYEALARKPPLTPPGLVFPIVWTILFALMGAGAARISLARERQGRGEALVLYLVQLAFNFFWTIIFFRFQNFGLALVWLVILWGLILGMILAFHKVDGWAARLQIPYLLWVSFAAYLNLGVWLLN